jgi:hypothetical protein
MGWSWEDGFPVYSDDDDWGLPPIDAPEPAELHEWLGWPPPDTEQTASCLQHIAATIMLAWAHTRGNGFTSPNMQPQLRAVILQAAARSLANPSAAKRIEAGSYVFTPANPGWLLHERVVLDGYRRQAA